MHSRSATASALELLRVVAATPRANETARIQALVSRLRELLPEDEDGVMVDAFVAGAETSLSTAPTLESARARGRADTLHGNVIIEFKRDLSASLSEATLELRRYVAARWTESGLTAAKLAVATDVIRWQVWTPIPLKAVGPWGAGDVDLRRDLILDASAANEQLGTELVRLVRRLVVQEPQLALTAENVRRVFGPASRLAAQGVQSIATIVAEGHGEVKLARALWSERARYGLDAGEDPTSYAAHAWLILLSRILVAASLGETSLDATSLRDILTGAWFGHALPSVERFVEHDLFGWTARPPFVERLIPVLARIADALVRFDMSTRPAEDVLGLLYQELMPSSTRLLFGQTRTPPALANRLAEAVLDELDLDAPVLDAACGGGSIFVALIGQRRAKLEATGLSPSAVAATIARSISAFDVDPVAVALAKANWVLVLRDLLKTASEVLTVPVIQADALFVARDNEDPPIISLDGDRFRVPIPRALWSSRPAFDAFVEWARLRSGQLAATERRDTGAVRPDWNAILPKSFSPDPTTTAELTEAARALVSALVTLELEQRDGIWAFVLRNRYSPVLLAGRYQAVVANPPWLALSRLPDAPYREDLEHLLAWHQIAPRGTSSHHKELATAFLMHAVDHYLSPGGRFAFVLPWGVADAGQHEAFRARLSDSNGPVRLASLWDLRKVDDLFATPACVLVGTKGDSEAQPRYLRWHHLDRGPADERPLRFTMQGSRTRWTGDEAPTAEPHDTHLDQRSTAAGYADRFGQGADLMPRTAVFVQADLEFHGTEVPVRTHPREVANHLAKVLVGRSFRGCVSRRFLWRTATSSSLLPFVLLDALPVVALPFALRDGSPQRVDNAELLDAGESRTHEWFAAIDNALREVPAEAKRGAVRVSSDLRTRLDVRRKLTRQRLSGSSYLVHYGAGGGIPCAAVQRVADAGGLPFVADQTTYVMATEDEDEAYYVAGVLNSRCLAERIRDFQARGAFGPRHIHELPLHHIPAWNPDAANKVNVAQAARQCEIASRNTLDERMLDHSAALPSRRSRLRSTLTRELHDLDCTVRLVLQ